MGKSLPSALTLQDFPRIVFLDKQLQGPKSVKPAASTTRFVQPRVKMEETSEKTRVPLAEVVSDCVKRWFQDTLKEAKAGDSAMQVLVGQMYYSGYGIPRDTQKGRAWISKASKSRSSVWKVSDKHPGYNASDSDSDDVKNDAK
ncbi:uncharacterized protein LOC132312453 isoform X1 [Cornus florida]|uniref:uncharacterized protein LOC132312453 isoform X1 n=2 Tax=Cornus florida TaxID=4283 RepID=UPI0028987FDD|nr:uncharacterized protein LOC132312453 isoform X1 [Cornus florida]